MLGADFQRALKIEFEIRKSRTIREDPGIDHKMETSWGDRTAKNTIKPDRLDAKANLAYAWFRKRKFRLIEDERWSTR